VSQARYKPFGSHSVARNGRQYRSSVPITQNRHSD